MKFQRNIRIYSISGDNIMKRYIVNIIIIIFLISIFIIIEQPPYADSSTENVEILEWTDIKFWNITDEQSISNTTRNINEWIIIKPGGTLLIENSTILINSTESPVVITVEKDAVLRIFDSNFSLSNILESVGYKLMIYGELFINNSIFNYLGYLSAICSYDTCSGEQQERTFTNGIEISSNNVKILNSNFRYSKDSSIFINHSVPKIENNIFSNNTKALTILNSTVDLKNNQFIDNYATIESEGSRITTTNCTFLSTYPESCLVGIAAYLSNIKVLHTRFQFVIDPISIEECTLSIENSNIEDCEYCFYYNSIVTIIESNIKYVRENFAFVSCSLEIENNDFEQSNKGVEIYSSNKVNLKNNSFNDLTSWAIEIHSSENISVENNTIIDNLVGLFYENSLASINNNKIINSTYAGIYSTESSGNITNNMISGNGDGINLIAYSGSIIKNIIIQNQEGIICEDSEILIMDNIIAENQYWGINISSCEMELGKNEFSNAQFNSNGYGKIFKYSLLIITVKDQFNISFQKYTLQIEAKNNDYFSEQNVNAFPQKVVEIPNYKILNNDAKVEFSEFRITAIYDAGQDYISESTTVNIEQSNSVEIIIHLPDLYILAEDIVISNENPKYGEEIKIKITLHYDGRIKVENVTVRVTANNAKIAEYDISFQGSVNTQTITKNITWEIPKFIARKVGIKVKIGPNDVEKKLPNYQDNNSASKLIEVSEDEDIDIGWTSPVGSILCGIMVIVLLLIIILIIMLLIKRKKPNDIHELDSKTNMKRLEPPTNTSVNLYLHKSKSNIRTNERTTNQKKRTFRDKLQDERRTGPRIKY